MENKISLFDTNIPPLAERVRPKSLKEFIGQSHILGENKILNSLTENMKLFSMILWGPPGSGKTTLARLMTIKSNYQLHQISAVSSGVKDLREIIDKSLSNRSMGKETVLFIDEIHRFNKSQQDALLHAVENGTIILIGATTENPSFEVISPLLSRSKVLTLNPLSFENLSEILDHAFEEDIILSKGNYVITETVKNKLIQNSSGDARKMLNTIDIAVNIVGQSGAITSGVLDEAFQNKSILYDKAGDYHYDTVSAFIKSMRGSDPDAAIYWLSVMIEGGEKPEFIARRMVIFASEDIGNADPKALSMAVSGFHAVSLIGYPEASIVLAQITTYLSSSPKSNASYMALNNSIEIIKEQGTPSVPLHLRNAPTDLMKNMEYGEGYKYPHSYENSFVNENYFPKDQSYIFYKPTDNGYEKYIKERLKNLWSERYE
ncbi:MAG: replication-associated recombination protein A [SAR202 cluster bacterium]|nr:replication-associated recombination protein A [SAR202 cluster bacterium]|tara:strand:- start:244 stop:1542 length:1299 start_codon:yes stop_codon:yes gene_type:complete